VRLRGSATARGLRRGFAGRYRRSPWAHHRSPRPLPGRPATWILVPAAIQSALFCAVDVFGSMSLRVESASLQIAARRLRTGALRLCSSSQI
jgi:hypothetical protein